VKHLFLCMQGVVRRLIKWIYKGRNQAQEAEGFSEGKKVGVLVGWSSLFGWINYVRREDSRVGFGETSKSQNLKIL